MRSALMQRFCLLIEIPYRLNRLGQLGFVFDVGIEPITGQMRLRLRLLLTHHTAGRNLRDNPVFDHCFGSRRGGPMTQGTVVGLGFFTREDDPLNNGFGRKGDRPTDAKRIAHSRFSLLAHRGISFHALLGKNQTGGVLNQASQPSANLIPRQIHLPGSFLHRKSCCQVKQNLRAGPGPLGIVATTGKLFF